VLLQESQLRYVDEQGNALEKFSIDVGIEERESDQEHHVTVHHCILQPVLGTLLTHSRCSQWYSTFHPVRTPTPS